MGMQPWKHIKEPEEIKIGWRTLTRKTFERPDGVPAEYVTFGRKSDRHGAVIALTPDNEVVVAEQFRPGTEMIMQELPGGNIEKGEDPQDGVMRELREEVGYTSDEVEFLGEAHKDAYMNATWYFYLARNCRKVSDQALEDGEFVNVRTMTIDEFLIAAKESRMSDAIAALMAYEKLQHINKEGK
jgi:8-oxo-dGTP pyrophosphatase MutT (NUDIX family)